MLTTDAVGGVWRYSLALAEVFAAQDIRVVLAAMGPSPDPHQLREAAAMPDVQVILTGLPLDWLAATPVPLRQASHELAGLATRYRVDTVHLHTPALVGDAAWPCPVVAVAHSCVGTWWRAVQGGTLPADLAWRADAVAQGITAADAVIAPSRSFAAQLVAAYSPGRPIEVVLNGRRPHAADAKRRSTVFTAGRLWDSGKNVAAIDAAAALLNVPVLAAGPHKAPHGASISYDNLHCLGTLDEAAMASHFAAAAVFVSMARYEPFGLAVLEAAQAACALVLSDIATFRELWDGVALFVDPADAGSVAAAIRECLLSPVRYSQLGALAQERARQFSVERMAAQTWRIHRALHAATTMRAA